MEKLTDQPAKISMEVRGTKLFLRFGEEKKEMRKVRYTRKQSIALGLIGGIFFIATGIVLATGGRDTIWGIVLLVLGVIGLFSSIQTMRNK